MAAPDKIFSKKTEFKYSLDQRNAVVRNLNKYFVLLAQVGVWYVGQLLLKRWFQLRVDGVENLPARGSVILAANHSSHLDGPAVVAAVNRGMNCVYSLAAKDYFFDKSVKGKFCQHILNMIPVQRRGKSLDALKTCKSIVKQNQMILLFPEGTRSKTGSLQPFKLGMGFLAMQLNVSVIPVCIEGSFQALPKGSFFPRRHNIRVAFGKPISVEAYRGRSHELSSRKVCREIVDEIRETIESLSTHNPPGNTAASTLKYL